VRADDETKKCRLNSRNRLISCRVNGDGYPRAKF
jgi:hypothetical protein